MFALGNIILSGSTGVAQGTFPLPHSLIFANTQRVLLTRCLHSRDGYLSYPASESWFSPFRRSSDGRDSTQAWFGPHLVDILRSDTLFYAYALFKLSISRA